MTRPMSRRRRTIPTFTEKRWLVSGRPYCIPFLQGGEWAQRLWKEFGEAITARHITKHPGTRPWGWWKYDAPQRPDSSRETQLAYLRLFNLLTEDERERLAHVRPRLTKEKTGGGNTSFQPHGTMRLPKPAPAGWQFVLIDDRVELVRAGTR